MIRSVTFDLDGTLLDTIADLAAGGAGMLAELGQPPRELAEIRSFVGEGMKLLVERCLTYDRQAPSAALLAAGIDAFRRHYALANGRAARLYEGVRAGLQAFADQGLPLGVVTNKPAQFTEPLLAATGLAGYFQVVVSGDTLAERKPHPAPIRYACERLGTAPTANLHIGDSIHDIEAAHAAGSLAYAVPYGYNGGHPVDAASCDALVSSLVVAAEMVAAKLNQPTHLKTAS